MKGEKMMMPEKEMKMSKDHAHMTHPKKMPMEGDMGKHMKGK